MAEKPSKEQRWPETASHVNAVCPEGSGLPSKCHSLEGRTAGFWAIPAIAWLFDRSHGTPVCRGLPAPGRGSYVSRTLPPALAVLKLPGLTEAQGKCDQRGGGRVTVIAHSRGDSSLTLALAPPQPWDPWCAADPWCGLRPDHRH